MTPIPVLPVVLSGGSGSRLWPLSRDTHPKQLLALTGTDSLLQATLRRVLDLPGLQAAAPLIVCGEDYRFVIAEQLRQMRCPGRIVLEPVGRNTAPAMALAAHLAGDDGDDPLMLVMPADHMVLDREAFGRALLEAAPLALAGAMVTFGVTPTAPETGYGYIQRGEALGGVPGSGAGQAWAIRRFSEKPDAATAERFLQAGDHLWNAGLFMVKASVWLSALRQCRPDIGAAVSLAWDARSTDHDFVRVPAALFAACPSDSIDFAVMERLAGGGAQAASLPAGVVVALDAGWSDVGAWNSVWQVMPKDAQGNAVTGDVVMVDTHDTLVVSEQRLVACCGVHDLVVVETADAVLVMHRDRAQDVKQIVERLKRDGRGEWQAHRKVHRPWGWYDSVDEGARFQVKRILVKPGAALSLQMHHHRAEHWIVVKGTAQVTCDGRQFLLTENESTFIPLGKVHRLENPGCFDLEMIEVQSGSYLGEDDIVRFEDAYGRGQAA
jgi:mannose-1-phosphate guanylyltransferase/mannose-6-phosphate isomerase